MIDITLLSYFTVFATCLLLSILLLFSDKKYNHLLMFNLVLCTWSYFNISFIVALTAEKALFFSRLAGVSMVGIPYFFLNTAISLSDFKMRKDYDIVNKSVALILVILMLSPYMFTEVRPFMDFKFVPSASPLFYLFLLYMVGLIGFGHFILYKSIRYNYKNKYIFYGYIIGWIGGISSLPQFLNIKIFPSLVILIATYTPFVTYALIRRRILDEISTLSIILIKLITLIILILSYVISAKIYILIGVNNEYFRIIFNIFYLISSIELYRVIVSYLSQARSRSEKVNIYNREAISANIKKHILNVVTIEELWLNLKDIIENQIGVKVTSFYVNKEIGAIEYSATRKNFLKYYGNEIQDVVLEAIEQYIDKREFNFSVKKDEVDFAFRNILDKTQSHGFITLTFNETRVGFLMLESRLGKGNFFYYDDMELFDDIADKSGYALERVRLHLKFLKEREQALKSLAGSIAHEMRNPISSIRSSVSAVDIDPKYADPQQLKKLCRDQLEDIIVKDANEIIEHKSHIDKSINLANSVIDMTLADLSGKKMSPSDFSYINLNKFINEAIAVYAFKDKGERERVQFNENNHFIFKGIETASYYILFNLIKNALYYVKDKPDLTITISNSKSLGDNIIKKSKKANNGNHLNLNPKLHYNIIHIEDNGPGIPPEILSKLFGNFVTSGKSEGTGLGLAFCKRTMADFGGDIDCESELGSWTRFNLYFPQLSDEELAKARIYFEELENNSNSHVELTNSNNKRASNINELSKKVLIVDDQEINLKISNKLIKKILPNAIIDNASNGKEALNLVKNNNSDDISATNSKYDLIITDIQMPIMDGFELTREIRKFNKNIPIAAYTSRTSYKIKQEALDIGINDYIIKPIPNNALIKVAHKWLINNHRYNYNIDEIRDKLKGLRVLIADDEAINIMVMKKFLEKYDIKVEAVNDGNNLVEKYITQFPKHDLEELDENDDPYYQDPNLTNKYDIIIADINMPNKKGDEAAKEIRHYELVHDIHHKAIIIANSGDSKESKLEAMLKSGMDDYFIKGEDNDKLLKIIYFWLSYNQKKKDPAYLNIDNKKHAQEDTKAEYKIINNKIENEDLLELRELFIKSTKDLIKKIKQAQKNKDIDDLAFQSHALKGIAGNVGAEKLFIHISMINNYAKKDKWPKEANWLKDLEEMAKEVFVELNKI